MFPKTKRFSRSDFLKHQIRGVSFLFGSIRVVVGEPKAAVVVSKKVSSRAVSRNALRRRIYAILRSVLRSGYLRRAVIIYPNKKAAAASFAELKAELERALARC
jgi:ribonuclease P protein component